MVEAFLQASGSTESMHLWCERPFYTTAGEPSVGFSVEGKKQRRFWCVFFEERQRRAFLVFFSREKYARIQNWTNFSRFLCKGYVSNMILYWYFDGWWLSGNEMSHYHSLPPKAWKEDVLFFCWLLLGILHPKQWGAGVYLVVNFFRIKQQVKCSRSNDTVDGRNPGQSHEHEIYETLSKMGYYPYQLVSRTSSINSMLGSW